MMAHNQRKYRDLAAAEWLIGKFREKLEWRADDLFRAAREESISRSAIFEAKGRLNLPRCKKVTDKDGNVCWFWWVPADWQPPAEQLPLPLLNGKPKPRPGRELFYQQTVVIW